MSAVTATRDTARAAHLHKKQHIEAVCLFPVLHTYHVNTVCAQVKCHACVGGTSVREDARILSSGVHVVVGTPGRVYDMLRRRCLRADSIKMFVLDEADEMLSRGFKDQIYDIFQLLPPKLQVRCSMITSTMQSGKALSTHSAASFVSYLAACEDAGKYITCAAKAHSKQPCCCLAHDSVPHVTS